MSHLVIQGKDRQSKARQGTARQGKARQGKARHGKAKKLMCSALLCSALLVRAPPFRGENPPLPFGGLGVLSSFWGGEGSSSLWEEFVAARHVWLA